MIDVASLPARMIHLDGCGGTAYYMRRTYAPGEAIATADTVGVDGSQLEPGEMLYCGCCDRIMPKNGIVQVVDNT